MPEGDWVAGRHHGVLSRTAVAVAIALLATVTAVATAYAASTRAEYVAQVDPICQAGITQAKARNRAFKKRIRPLVRRGIDPQDPPKALIHLYVRYLTARARIRRSDSAQIAAVPPASGDESAVSEWLRARDRATDLFEHSIHALSDRKLRRWAKLNGRASRAEINAEFFVEGFGFRFCTPFLANP